MKVSFKTVVFVLSLNLLNSCSQVSSVTNQTNALNESLAFFQMSYSLDQFTAQNTQWGALDLSYTVPTSEKYLNVVVNGQWQIQNAPLITYLDTNGQQERITETYYFNLFNTPGTPADGIQYAYTISDSVRSSQPSSIVTGTIAPRHDSITTDYPTLIYSGIPTPGPLVGGPTILACRHGYPNQDCGPYECVPAAVSNGLKWLDSIYHLHMDSLIGIDSMKSATGWTPPIKGVPGSGGCTPGAWVQQKINYVNARNKDKAGSMPISTTKYAGAQIAMAFQHWKDNCVFELDIGNATNDGGHCVSVTCMGQVDNGPWMMKVSSDMAQGTPGGQEVSSIEYDPSTNTITSGPAWAKGRPILNIIVECKQ